MFGTTISKNLPWNTFGYISAYKNKNDNNYGVYATINIPFSNGYSLFFKSEKYGKDVLFSQQISK